MSYCLSALSIRARQSQHFFASGWLWRRSASLLLSIFCGIDILRRPVFLCLFEVTLKFKIINEVFVSNDGGTIRCHGRYWCQLWKRPCWRRRRFAECRRKFWRLWFSRFLYCSVPFQESCNCLNGYFKTKWLCYYDADFVMI